MDLAIIDRVCFRADDEQDFLERQFTETYENFHTERLNSMSKTELVQENIALEERVDDLQKRLHLVTQSVENASLSNKMPAGNADETQPDSSSRDSEDKR